MAIFESFAKWPHSQGTVKFIKKKTNGSFEKSFKLINHSIEQQSECMGYGMQSLTAELEIESVWKHRLSDLYAENSFDKIEIRLSENTQITLLKAGIKSIQTRNYDVPYTYAQISVYAKDMTCGLPEKDSDEIPNKAPVNYISTNPGKEPLGSITFPKMEIPEKSKIDDLLKFVVIGNIINKNGNRYTSMLLKISHPHLPGEFTFEDLKGIAENFGVKKIEVKSPSHTPIAVGIVRKVWVSPYTNVLMTEIEIYNKAIQDLIAEKIIRDVSPKIKMTESGYCLTCIELIASPSLHSKSMKKEIAKMEAIGKAMKSAKKSTNYFSDALGYGDYLDNFVESLKISKTSKIPKKEIDHFQDALTYANYVNNFPHPSKSISLDPGFAHKKDELSKIEKKPKKKRKRGRRFIP